MSAVTLNHFLIVSALLFSIGMLGVIMRRNAIIVFMSIEIMINGVNLALVGFSRYLLNLDGQILVLFAIAVAAAEAAVGLALVIAIFRNRDTVDIEQMNLLKG